MFRGMQRNTVANANVNIYDVDTIQGAIESAFLSVIPKCTIHPKLTCSSR